MLRLAYQWIVRCFANTLNHPRYFVFGGRHDLVTRPILGWWTRRMAVQPVVRKAELLRGGCSEEEANFLNGRSLMTLASGISHGYGCVLFPEVRVITMLTC